MRSSWPRRSSPKSCSCEPAPKLVGRILLASSESVSVLTAGCCVFAGSWRSRRRRREKRSRRGKSPVCPSTPTTKARRRRRRKMTSWTVSLMCAFTTESARECGKYFHSAGSLKSYQCIYYYVTTVALICVEQTSRQRRRNWGKIPTWTRVSFLIETERRVQHPSAPVTCCPPPP